MCNEKDGPKPGRTADSWYGGLAGQLDQTERRRIRDAPPPPSNPEGTGWQPPRPTRRQPGWLDRPPDQWMTRLMCKRPDPADRDWHGNPRDPDDGDPGYWPTWWPLVAPLILLACTGSTDPGDPAGNGHDPAGRRSWRFPRHPRRPKNGRLPHRHHQMETLPMCRHHDIDPFVHLPDMSGNPPRGGMQNFRALIARLVAPARRVLGA